MMGQRRKLVIQIQRNKRMHISLMFPKTTSWIQHKTGDFPLDYSLFLNVKYIYPCQALTETLFSFYQKHYVDLKELLE